MQSLTVTENIFLGRMPRALAAWWTEKGPQAGPGAAQADECGQIRRGVSRLSMWQCQVVEITKAMSHGPQVLILDEPTSPPWLPMRWDRCLMCSVPLKSRM